MPRTLISIHDVMPESLADVEGLLSELGRRGLLPTTLLVVPGRDWDDDDIARLRRWQAQGNELAAHGWSHRAGLPRTLGHRLHAAAISRDCGEHLSRPRANLVALLARSHRWFGQHDLGAPRLYVPPAWALGDLAARDLAQTPFALVETLGGVHLPASRRFRRLPVVGFEADTRWRARALSAAGALADAHARRAGWLRVALHPRDLRLRLADTLRRRLDAVAQPGMYGELLDRPGDAG